MACVLASGCSLVFPLQGSPDARATTDSGVDAGGDGALPPDGPSEITCPQGYVTLGSSRYRVIGTATRFEVARQQCVQDRTDETGFTHLAVLDDEVELAMLTGDFLADVVWIGLTRATPEPAPFTTVTVQATAFPPPAGLPWFIAEPTSTDLCATINPQGDVGGGVLVGEACEKTILALCECDAFEPLP
jgi:hypothetical protein